MGEKNGDDFGRMHGWYGQKNRTNVGRLSEAICSEESVILGRDVNRNLIFLFVICSYDVQFALIFVSTMSNPISNASKISQKCPPIDIHVYP